MKIQDQLQQFLDATPAASLAAFGDLSSNLILNWSSRTACPRETLDLLGEKASACFALFQPETLPPGVDTAVFAASVVHFTERSSHVFARWPSDAEDVVCVTGAPGARLEPLLQASLVLADKIAGGP